MIIVKSPREIELMKEAGRVVALTHKELFNMYFPPSDKPFPAISLKNCYILPVRFGDEYLTCNPKIITDEIQRNMSLKVILVVRVPQNNKGYFEGYFRMFTPGGLPFGNVLCVKVLNGDQ